MNKKYVLLIFLLSISCLVQAQSRKKKSKQKPNYAIGVSGGYFFHGHMFDKSENNFKGLKTYQIEVQKYHEGKKSDISLGFASRKSEYKPSTIIIDESRYALYLNYTILYNLKKKNNGSGVYIGAFSGVLFDRGEQIPRSNFAFPYSTKYYAFWMGFKTEYLFQINTKFSISAGGQLGLLEFGNKTTRLDDPNLPVRLQLKSETYLSFAQRINLSLGINFTL